MNYNEKKRFLELYHDIVLDIIVLTQDIIAQRENMLPSGQKLSDMPKSRSQRDQMAEFAVRIDEKEREIEFLMKTLRNIEDSIENLEKAEHRYVLKLYYVQEGYTWGKIGQTLRTSERNARRISHRAIESLKIANPQNATAIMNYYRRKDTPKSAGDGRTRPEKRKNDSSEELAGEKKETP